MVAEKTRLRLEALIPKVPRGNDASGIGTFSGQRGARSAAILLDESDVVVVTSDAKRPALEMSGPFRISCSVVKHCTPLSEHLAAGLMAGGIAWGVINGLAVFSAGSIGTFMDAGLGRSMLRLAPVFIALGPVGAILWRLDRSHVERDMEEFHVVRTGDASMSFSFRSEPGSLERVRTTFPTLLASPAIGQVGTSGS